MEDQDLDHRTVTYVTVPVGRLSGLIASHRPAAERTVIGALLKDAATDMSRVTTDTWLLLMVHGARVSDHILDLINAADGIFFGKWYHHSQQH